MSATAKRSLAAGVAVLAMLLAPAATTSAAETRTSPPTTAIENVLAAVTLSFRNDGAMDRAVLVAGEDGADLYLFLAKSAADGPDKLELALAKTNFVWKGSMWGTLPDLAATDRGSLIVRSRNLAIGRDKWEQALTIAWRDGDFRVVGVTYSSHDGLDPKAGGSCDLNLVTGKGSRDGKPVATAARATKVADWTDDSLPAECRF